MGAEVIAPPTPLVLREHSGWANPYRQFSLSGGRSAQDYFVDWIDSQPWFREALVRESLGMGITPGSPETVEDAEVLEAFLNLTASYPFRHPHFVFGANRTGRYIHGTAKEAITHYGADRDVSEGVCRKSYAIETRHVQTDPLPVKQVTEGLANFIAHARAHPEQEYIVTRVGCGIAKHEDWQVGPAVEGAPANVFLPGLWERYREPGLQAPTRVMIAAPPNAEFSPRIGRLLEQLLESLAGEPELVSNADGEIARAAETLFLERGLRVERFPTWERTEGHGAGYSRYRRMCWRATHLVALTDRGDRSVHSAINLASKARVRVKELPLK